MRSLVPAAVLLLTAVCASAAASAADDEAQATSYEFLRRQGSLLFEYGKFDEAATALEQACALPQGRRALDCHQRLATAAERAGRIGIAIRAWEAQAALGGEGQEAASAELLRLRAAWGRVAIQVPRGGQLPSLPLIIEHRGFLIDPQIKSILSATTESVATSGITDAELWLPAGAYRLGPLEIEVPADGVADVSLPRAWVPHRPVAFSLLSGAGRGVGGPTELAVLVSVRSGGVPTGDVGIGPLGAAARVALARRAGPVRLQIGARFGALPVRSLGPDPDGERRNSGVELLADVGVGVDLAPHPRWRLTPHVAAVAGRLGAPLVPCVAVHPTSAAVHRGECRLTAVGVGGAVGLDATVALGPEPSRVLARAGLAVEVLGAGFVAAPGDPVVGRLSLALVRVDPWRFVRLGAGMEVGVALRF